MISALLALAPTLIVPALRGIERIFGAKTGATKMETAISALLPILEKAAAAGKLPGIPDAATLQTVIETLFQQNRKEIENSDVPAPAGREHTLLIPAGAVITIQFPSKEAS